MESYSTVDIFATKGTEYLFIIGYLLVLIAFWALASRPLKVVTTLRRAIGVLSERVLSIPQGVYYSRNHTWTHLEESGEAKVGIDGLVQNITGEILYKNLSRPGDKIVKGGEMTEIEHNGKLLKISAPISGEITEINPLLNEDHDTLRSDPYGAYWIYKVKPDRWKEETGSFMLADEASAWIRMELERFKDFLAVSMSKHSPQTEMVALQEGGELMGDTLAELPDEIWNDFQKEFLSEA